MAKVKRTQINSLLLENVVKEQYKNQTNVFFSAHESLLKIFEIYERIKNELN